MTEDVDTIKVGNIDTIKVGYTEDPLEGLLKEQPRQISPLGSWMGYSMGSSSTERRVGELEQGIRAALAALDGCYSTDAKSVAVKILQSIPGFAPRK